MKRTLITENDLISLLNKKLQEYEEFKKCKFESINKRKEYDSAGCNWYKANLRCSGVSIDSCLPIADRIVNEAKTKYNIKK